MTEKEIKTEVTKKLNQGASKSVVYNEYKGEINDESLRKILASRPSKELKLTFKKTHLVLSIIWGFFILLELIGVLDLIANFDLAFFFSLVISIYITINIWNFDGRFFLPGIVWFGFTIINSLRELSSIIQYEPDNDLILLFALTYSLILVLGIYLMYTIRKNVFNYYNWFQPIINSDKEILFEEQLH